MRIFHDRACSASTISSVLKVQFASSQILSFTPAQAEGSYTGTERRVEITSRVVDFEGVKYAVETRGQWRSFGDFMGGPFVSYTLLSPDGTQLVELIGFVYCPRFDKRDYLMQVDGICRSIKWPAVE